VRRVPVPAENSTPSHVPSDAFASFYYYGASLGSRIDHPERAKYSRRADRLWLLGCVLLFRAPSLILFTVRLLAVASVWFALWLVYVLFVIRYFPRVQTAGTSRRPKFHLTATWRSRTRPAEMTGLSRGAAPRLSATVPSGRSQTFVFDFQRVSRSAINSARCRSSCPSRMLMSSGLARE
jgi:hypothetical protein